MWLWLCFAFVCFFLSEAVMFVRMLRAGRASLDGDDFLICGAARFK